MEYISHKAGGNILHLIHSGHGPLRDIQAAWRDTEVLIVERISATETDVLARITNELPASLGGFSTGINTNRQEKTLHDPDCRKASVIF